MRFLFGIFMGAVVTLLVATAMDAPTDPILNNAKDLAATGWDRLIHATSSSLFDSTPEGTDPSAAERSKTKTEESSRTPTIPADQASTTQPDTDSAATDSGPLDEQAAYAALEYAALEPVPALSAPEPVDQSPPSEFWVETALALERNSHASQPVWVPFHSQMSAEGFATRLSQALDHDFRVVRQGAGAYQVVFDASDADQQALIMAQVTEITGQ